MRLSTRLIIALTVITLIVVLIGIDATYETFTAVFRRIELVFSNWGSIFILFCLGICSLCIVCGLFLGLWLAVVEIQIRRQKYLRFAPSEQGYYEALITSEGFCKPADNVSLQVPFTYSPHIIQAKKEVEQPQSDDGVVLELYQKGLSMSAVSKATGRPYSQVQKIIRAKNDG